jgi:hypothetical protein
MEKHNFNQLNKVEYLGDGVYISDDGYQLKLMANDHLYPTDIIYLDQSTFKSLLSFIKQHTSWIQEE